MPGIIPFLKPQIYLTFILVFLIAAGLRSGRPATVEAQTTTNETDPAVEAIFNTLTPEERVGQLFIVSFQGADTTANSDIAELIQEYRVGGVVVSAQNQNFPNSSLTPARVLALTNSLQFLAREKPVTESTDNQPETITPGAPGPVVTDTVDIYTPMPLFIAVSHEGDGYPYTQIRGGLVELPNPMALGATWNVENARVVGQVVGRELSLLGVNVLFGPVLDVLETPRPNSLGTRTFGGHSFWVGEMGQAYIQGVEEGSNNQLLTIAKHFPGFGSSDREINQGVPTIIKSLDQMRRTDLAPFFKVTHMNPDDPTDMSGLTDGLMTAHVRYQGLQGNVPMSLDARNLPALLALKEIAPWREAGGLVVSAPLGAPAALEGISADRENFPARRLAQDAFLAGSDLLLLVDFAYENNPENELANIKNAIGFFQEKYASDANFQAVVDRSVRRIIKAKIKIFGQDMLEQATRYPVTNLTLLEDVAIDLDQIAQAGVTPITPLTRDGSSPLPGPPEPNDSILIFTDDRVVRDCPDCPEFPLIETTALQQIILQLFGPNATGQILPEQINSRGFAELKAAVSEEAGGEENEEIEALIAEADWILFAMLDLNTQTHPNSDAVRVLLRNRYDSLRNKNLVVFAFNAPYFLDETEISQLTAYYGFYSKQPAYLRAAARLLFQQFEPAGASPVAIPAIGALDLNPDPSQTIQLEPIHEIDTNGNVVTLPDQQQPITTLDLEVGQGILFRTDVIVDRNGNPVPDGTLVDFFRFYPLEGLSLEPLSASTTGGVAEITIIKERDTPLQVRASSNLAAQSVPFDIGPGIIDTPTPTATATPTLTPEPPTLTPVPPTSTPVPPTPTPEPPPPLPTEPATGLGSSKMATSRPVDILDLVYSLLGMALIGGIAFALGGDRFSLEERVRPALVAVAAGLVGYIFYIFIAMAFARFGYVSILVQQGIAGHWVAPLISLSCAIVGMALWYLKPGRIFWEEVGSTSQAKAPGKE